MQVYDEHGQPINQLAETEPRMVNPILAAWLKVTYEHDEQFRAAVDTMVAGFVEAVNRAMEDLDDHA